MRWADFLAARVPSGGLSTDDALASFLPLARQVVQAHAAGLVAPLEGLDKLRAEGSALVLDADGFLPPRTAPELLRNVEAAVEIEIPEEVGVPGRAIDKPVFLPGFRTWESALGSHDALTDTFLLGLVLGSLVSGLDLGDPAKLGAFVRTRRNPFTLNPRLDPVVAKILVGLTEPDRHRRIQDLWSAALRLERYRDQTRDFDAEGLPEDPKSRRQALLARLKERLFEISRRNRLVYFRSTKGDLDLTTSSIGMSTAAQNIRADRLLTWREEIAALLADGRPIALGSFLRFEELSGLPETLDRILTQARRDQTEFGFAQLRLMIAFLRWHNLKEFPADRIHSPVLLLPVRLSKKKGIRDSYVLAATRREAEVNPALRHLLRSLFGIRLPETLELSWPALEEFLRRLAASIRAGEPAVTLARVDRPRVRLDGTATRPVGHEASPDAPPNPYAWEFDLASVTLGNLRYRKMSLVRDYESLEERDLPHAVFDELFSPSPKESGLGPAEPAPLQDRFWVLPCDPTQSEAISVARKGKSYIIQGPPGTGKSQTIANLIADYAARGKRVLFVAEKRPAIDVVYRRLAALGLDEISSLIHDAQEDKKEFIQDLKKTYESFLLPWDPPAERSDVVRALAEERAPLERFDAAMRRQAPGAGVSIRELLGRLADLEHCRDAEGPVPAYSVWAGNREQIRRFSSVLGQVQKDGVFAHHPLSSLDARVAAVPRPVDEISRGIEGARGAIEAVRKAFSESGLPLDTLQASREAVEIAGRIRFLAEGGAASLLNEESPASLKMDMAASLQAKRREALAASRKVTLPWKDKLPPAEVEAALAEARRLEGSWFRFLRPSWWRLRWVLRSRYDWKSHVIRPSWVKVLESLQREQSAEAAFEDGEREFRKAFPARENSESFVSKILALRKELRETFVRSASNAAILSIADAGADLEKLDAALGGFYRLAPGATFSGIAADLDSIDRGLGELADFLPCLSELARLPAELQDAFRRLKLDAQGLEAAMARRSLREAYAGDRELERFTGTARESRLAKLESLQKKFLDANAGHIRALCRKEFLDRASQGPEEKLTAYSLGRKELEHEFGKTTRYKSIRELLEGPSGVVIRDLKRVWLMSPLGVSDALPMDAGAFDAVIFDEASQLTLESAAPSLFRAGQAIVVGDRMQLPPTSFFFARSEEEEDSSVQVDLAANSFLHHASGRLPGLMLGWHYRSRSEALIGFSNAAFYQGRLRTVPEPALPRATKPIVVSAPGDGAGNWREALSRSISFHYVPRAVYASRRNREEARYVAELVRGFVGGKTGLTIGVVAFSEAQQDEIERALDDLAVSDGSFCALLEEELERQEDDQFAGLFVRNLENVQGDERDILILSVCYGPDREGRFQKNFGPINQNGGEKRLNVAFSRARSHMCVVSSIRADQITNEWSDGAKCLKNYLRYAEAVSAGDDVSAKRALKEASVLRARESAGVRIDEVTSRIATALGALGYEADFAVGRSDFRADLAVRSPGEVSYRAAVLVDSLERYREAEILARDVLVPRLLEQAGWRVARVLAKDWVQDPSGVLARLRGLVGGT